MRRMELSPSFFGRAFTPQRRPAYTYWRNTRETLNSRFNGAQAEFFLNEKSRILM